MINKLLGREKNNTSCKSLILDNGVKINDSGEMAEKFNDHFSTVADKLYQNLPQIPLYQPSHFMRSRPVSQSFYFSPTDSQEIKEIIGKLRSKNSCSLDGITTKMIKCFPINLICILSYLVNRSLSEGLFPNLYKHTKVVPIPKKGGRATDVQNYRPISLLPSLSKIFEKVASKRLISFLNKHKILNPNQFGFRKNHSTADAASYVINKIACNIDKGLYTMGIFCDLSKAFDCLHIPTLLKKLQHYGVRGLALNWFQSYMNGRSQVVEVNGEISKTPRYLSNGTPQGSILGPSLFIIYINDMQNCLKHESSVFFADDTSILVAHSNYNTVVQRGNEDLQSLSNWMISNKLTLNAQKTKVIIFRSRGKKIPEIRENITVLFTPIEVVSETIFLGLNINEHLNWKSHMQDLQKEFRKRTAIISKVKRQLNSSALLKIYQSLILGKIRYCISAWCFGNKTTLNALQRTCNNFIRMIFGLRRRDSIKNIMKINRIPTINQMLVKELSTIMHKYYNNNLPPSLHSLFPKVTHRMTTRSGNEAARNSFKTTLSQQTITYRATHLWNLLPNSIKYMENENSENTKKSYQIPSAISKSS